MLTIRELSDKQQTGREMYDLVEQFSSDLDMFNVQGVPVSKLPLQNFYQLIREVPFKKDLYGIELVSRPLCLLTAPFRGWDCKKKGIVVASYLRNRGIPWRFVASSRRPDGRVHHVFPEAKIDGQWVPIDATYSSNKLFEPLPWTHTEVLPDVQGDENLSDCPLLVSMYGYDNSPEMIGEFQARARQMCPERMGSIVAAIIVGAAALTGTIIGAVSGKRQQDREAEYASSLIHEQAAIEAEQIATAEQARQAEIDKILSFGKKYALPSGIALGLLLLS